jgi:hypothetical protein
LSARNTWIAGIILITLSLIFLVLGTVMPYYKSPQRLEGTGPNVNFSPEQTYWINSYYIPPIDKGSEISLNVLSDRPGRTTVLLAPYDDVQQVIIGPVLANVAFASDQKELVVFTKANRPGPYFLTITSYNSTYIFYLTSIWSPFYGLRQLVVYAFLLLPFGVVTAYYSRIMESREKMAEQALAGIRRHQEES